MLWKIGRSSIASIEEIEHAFAWQVDWCTKLGSPFTATLLQLALDDLKAKGPVFDLCGDWQGPPIDDALTLRLTGALNALVLQGKAPILAAHYPTATDAPDWGAVKAAMLATLQEHDAEVRAFLKRAVQTNEIGRSNCLMPGFLTIAGLTDRPLHLAEIGASGGLNLLWDRFHYKLAAGQTWGDSNSPVRLKPNWEGPLPDLTLTPFVASRAGVDISPLDLSTDAAITAASAYIWPDQPERLQRFRAAAQMLNDLGIKVEKGDAADWVETQLASRPDDGALVIYHSIMWQYMPPTTQDRITQLIEGAGAKASKEAPLAWLAFEPDGGTAMPELRLRFWDGTQALNTRLAWAHPHGTDIEWL
ncbi:MAG: DUF2332 domain-containing protein [Alphaproteobacteria bacterium]